MAGHSQSPGYKRGDHWVNCDRCGFNYYGSQCRMEWSGSFVCRDCFETRHPQDFVKSKVDRQIPSGPVRPEPAIVYGQHADTTTSPVASAEGAHTYGTFYANRLPMLTGNPDFTQGDNGMFGWLHGNTTALTYHGGSWSGVSWDSQMIWNDGITGLNNDFSWAYGKYKSNTVYVKIVVDSYTGGSLTAFYPWAATQLGAISSAGTFIFSGTLVDSSVLHGAVVGVNWTGTCSHISWYMDSPELTENT